MISFDVQGKNVDVFAAAGPDKPVVCLNTFGPEGNKVHQKLQEIGSPDCTLVAVSGLDWDHDMSPWECPPISKVDKPCSPGADDYLDLLLREILPEAETHVEGKPAWHGIAGYSLAGLFAVYAVYRTDLFSRVASMSGSLWFPGLKEYIFTQDMKICPDCMYFSLGSKEHKTRNSYLKTVLENTEAIQAFYEDRGIDSVFVQNPGNHYVDAVGRTAAGIDWILKRNGSD